MFFYCTKYSRMGNFIKKGGQLAYGNGESRLISCEHPLVDGSPMVEASRAGHVTRIGSQAVPGMPHLPHLCPQ